MLFRSDVANCSITEYVHDPAAGKHGGLTLVRYNVTAPVDEDPEAETTSAPDAMVAARG